MLLLLPLLILLIETHVLLDIVGDEKLLYTVIKVKDIIAFNLVSGQAYKDAESAAEINVKVC